MKYSLNIYGENDAILKTYETNVVPWGVFIRAAAISEEIKSKKVVEQLESIGEILELVFIGLTKEELVRADANDVMNLFLQITGKGKGIGGNSKNV